MQVNHMAGCAPAAHASTEHNGMLDPEFSNLRQGHLSAY